MLRFLLTQQVFPIFYAFSWKFPTFSSRYIPFWPGDITKESHVCLIVAKSWREHPKYLQIWRMVLMSYQLRGHFILIYRKDWSSHVSLKNLENVCFKCEIWKYSYIFIIFCRLFWAFRAFYSAGGQLKLFFSTYNIWKHTTYSYKILFYLLTFRRN